MKNKFTTFINGNVAKEEVLEQLAFAGHAHFTAMQMRDYAVKGFEFHMTRLLQASQKLFSMELKEGDVIEQLQAAIREAPKDSSILITVFSSDGEFTQKSKDAELNIMIKTSAAHNGPTGPMRLKSFEYQRPLADTKHVGEIAKTYFMREAHNAGFDDAIFVHNNRVLEGSIWNLVGWDGEGLVWPKGPKLHGTMMQIIEAMAQQAGIKQSCVDISLSEIEQLDGLALLNSWTPCVPIAELDGIKLKLNHDFYTLLRTLYDNAVVTRLTDLNFR
ncbi:aminotransferase class IV [Pseudoalteromonas sp. PS5]|uniref:aminotransferase class IV n=1 Tax=Pseudoalteromonas sp. PS5 TaxID=1437473 RepID=UPI000FFEF38F|nr:aminotransferase class IV [Pseudoalteromonas sp. PS5]RXF04318.1 aminotransferase class IV [Pseudoalteromonas sp. PS5]